MKNDTTTALQMPEASTKDVLTDILRDGAREMLGNAIEAEVADYIAAHAHERDANGRRLPDVIRGVQFVDGIKEEAA